MTTVKLTGNFLATARCLIFSDSGGLSWNFNQNTNTLTASATSGGTFLSSVGLADNSTVPIYTVGNSPLTANGTLTLTLNTQAAALVLAGPTTGAAAQPTFRALVATDIPVLAYVTSIGSSNLTIGGTAAVPTVNLSTTQVTNIGLGGTALQSVSVIDSITGNGTGGSPLQLSGDAASPGNSFYYGTNGSGTRGWYASLASGAASASVGLSAVVGSGTAYMLANAAPALSQAIVPTWTGLHTFSPGGGGATLAQVLNGTIALTGQGSANIQIKPAGAGAANQSAFQYFASDNNLYIDAPATGTPTGGKIFFRTGSTTTTALTLDASQKATFAGAVGVNGASPPAKVTGWGTPTNQAVVANYNATTATLLQTADVVAQLITDLKAFGLYGA